MNEYLHKTSREQKPIPWNKGRLLGQKLPLKPKEVWSIRVRLQMGGAKRELAMFNLAIDSKLRASDLVSLKVSDVSAGGRPKDRGVVIQRKTRRPVQFEITEGSQEAAQDWIETQELRDRDYLFPGQMRGSTHLSTRQYSRIVERWVKSVGLDSTKYGTHSMRRTKAAMIYKKTGNLRAVQLLLGHNNLESTVRYLGVEVDDALQLAEQVEL